MRQLHKEHPDYFDDAPYPEAVERYFRGWFDTPLSEDGSSGHVDARVAALTGDDKYDQLYVEVVDLYNSLRNAKPSGGDSAESMSYYRTTTGLIDKLITHQERCLGLKKIHEFHTTVLDIMENVLTPDQRNEAIARLKAAIKES